MSNNPEAYFEQLEFGKELAQDAGEIMLKYFQVGVTYTSKADGHQSPLTIADDEINELVISRVKAKFPEYAVIGEEKSHRAKNPPYTVVVDPIDGTLNYVMGVPTNVFSFALVNPAGQPVVAVVNDPYMKRLYWAPKGGGAFMNGNPIKVNAVGDISQAYIGCNPNKYATMLNSVDFCDAVIRACNRPIMYSSTIYEAMLVATGQIAATMFVQDGAHDIASAKLIVEEAGGKVTNIFGNEQRYDRPLNGAIVSNGLVHKAIAEIALKYRYN